MTLKELLEAAHLDALGLLDDDERDAFERAFASANQSVRAQVRDEQARWATTLANSAGAEPPPALRDRVLAAVRAAQREAQNEVGTSASADVLGAITPAGTIVTGKRRSNAVSPAWRAAALGMATAAAVLLAAFLSLTRQVDSLRDRAQNDVALEVITKAYGRDLLQKAIFGKDTQRYVFEPVNKNAAFAGTSAPAAALLHIASMNETRVIIDNMLDAANDAGKSVRVVIVDDQNNVLKQVAEFTPTGQLCTESLKHFEPTNGMRLAIAVAEAGKAATPADVRMVLTINA